MDPRSNKAVDFVATSKNITEESRKLRIQQINWLQKFEWLLDQYTELQKDVEQLCLERKKARPNDSSRMDKRSCLPLPSTVNREYGWLAAKPDFQLEKYGSLIVKYPDPMEDIVHVPGDVPLLAVGKGFLR